jgi:hypothetical protein
LHDGPKIDDGIKKKNLQQIKILKGKKINLGKVINDVDRTNECMLHHKSGPH